MHFGAVGQPGADGVDVRIDQARDDGAAAKIDRARDRAGQRTNFVAAADFGNAAVADGERLRGSAVETNNLAVEQNGVGMLSLQLPWDRANECCQKRGATSQPPQHGGITIAGACN